MSVSNIFETLMVTGVQSGLDNQQTALAVQALLESQLTSEAPPVDDDDLFQCGKCKKQFTSLTSFLGHKQTHCTVVVQNAGVRSSSGGTVAQQVAAQAKQNLPAYSAVPSSPLPQNLGASIVLTDDLLSFAAPVDQSINASLSTLQVGSNPFLSQVSPSVARSSASNNALLVTTSTGPTYSVSTSSAFNSILSNNQSLQAASLTNNQSLLATNQNVLSSIQLQPATLVSQQPSSLLGDQATDTTHVIIQASEPQNVLAASAPAVSGSSVVTGTTPKPVAVLRPGSSKHMTRKVTSLALSNGQLTVLSEDDITLPTASAAPSIPPAVSGTVTSSAPTQVPKFRRTKPVPEEPDSKKKLKCQYCDKTFAKNFDLQQHVRSHTGEKPFQCIVCGRAFAQKSNVKKHMQTHKVWPQGTGKTLPAQPPPKLISMEEAGTNLVEMVSQTGPAAETPPAQIMEVSLKKKKLLEDGTEQPVQLNVVVDSSYMCQYCPAKFKSYFQLKSHMLQHKEQQVYKCILKSCSCTFSELDGFLEHTKSHEDNMSYRCHMCNKLFPSLYELGVHQYSHSLYPNQGPKPGPRYFRCVKCNSKYSTPEALQHHIDTVSHKHPCPHCQKIFTCERYLRRHLPIHGSFGPHQCEECGKHFKTEHYLKVHMLIHSTEKPFACEHCPSAFNRKDKLKRHMLIHETTKRYRCPFRSHVGCTKEFNRPDKLKAHIICHSGIKPYKCKECGKSFTRRPNLRQHERGHRHEWTSQCTFCGKGFLRENLLKSHHCKIQKYIKGIAKEAGAEEFIPTEVAPGKEHLRKKNKAMYRNLRVSTRRGRPRKSNRPTPATEKAKANANVISETVIPEESVPDELSEEIAPMSFSVSDINSTEISVVVGNDATHYVTSQEDSAIVRNEDGNLLVIQPLSEAPMSNYPTSIQGELSMTGTVQEVQYEHIKQDTAVDIINVTAEDVASMVPVSGSEIVSSYSLDYSPQSSIYQTNYGAVSSFQNATFISAGPNMATLVVEGPDGEVLSQENIASIVAQNPDQFADVTHQYNVLQYPMGTDDDGSTEVTIMTPSQLMGSDEEISEEAVVKVEGVIQVPSPQPCGGD